MYLGVDERCDVSIDLDTSGLGTVNGQLVVTDTDFGQTTTVDVAAEIVPPDPPANDDWTNAQDISTLTIPAWVGEPGLFGNQQPRDTVQIDGNTTYATYESGEYDPGRGGGSVWYQVHLAAGRLLGPSRVSSDARILRGGVDGEHLGHRVAPGQGQLGDAGDQLRADGTGSHDLVLGLQRVAVRRPGDVHARVVPGPERTGPDRHAYERNRRGGEFALVDDFNLFGDGDTHHLTPDLGGCTERVVDAAVRSARLADGDVPVVDCVIARRCVRSERGKRTPARSADLPFPAGDQAE